MGFEGLSGWLGNQCVQIGQFIAISATFQSLRQQLFCPNCPFFSQFLERCQNMSFGYQNHFWANFIDIWRLFTRHVGLGFVLLSRAERMRS